MFVTFYSYKGGLGRTLAVANVAYLLATHDEEPCRVLVWDFDLEAPGLQQVFKCKWRGERIGFVDLVYEYITKAQIPDVQEYIHPTDVKGVDILPAGNLTKRYSQRLEEIDWREVYERRRGYDFINAVRTAIAEMRTDNGQPKYDYVLIDARTGYSDVGGICVQQLPDVVVLMFRLNDQNIKGSAEVHKSIQSYVAQAEGRHIDVLPVISPAWPFGAPEAARYVKRAEKAFGGRSPLAITFEGALSYGERIITRERDRYPTGLRICDDYARLTEEIRGLNDEDALTAERSG
jgi:MinD-like ATPase involved in chromosome partitioning or flagellar assembly